MPFIQNVFWGNGLFCGLLSQYIIVLVDKNDDMTLIQESAITLSHFDSAEEFNSRH